MKKFTCLLWPFLFTACSLQKNYVVTDLTPEGSFSQNCEGPNVDKAGNLYVVNYLRDGTVGIITPEGKASIFVELPQGSTANSIRFDSRGDMLLADFTGHNILRVEMATRRVSVFCHDERFNQPNDLCISRDDVIYASDPNWKEDSGQLWRIGPDGKADLLETDMGTTNGIELSPDGRRLYLNESTQRNIWAYDVAPDGSLSDKRLFAHFDEHVLDGMKCDQHGNLYVARYGNGTIAVLSAEGKLLREVALKGKNVSNLIFGGKDKRTVFATLQDRRCVEQFRNKMQGQ